jgi:glutathione S-transferase
MIRLLGRATSGNVQKVIFALEEIGAPYAREDYGRQYENTGSPAYRAMNPPGKVPTLVDGAVTIWESNTILRYLAATRSPHLGGATPAEAAAIGSWMDFLLATINPGYLSAFKEAKLAPAERSAGYDAAIKDLVAALALIDGALAGRDFLALGRLTLADIALAPILKRCLDFPIDRPALPELERWMAAIAARPAFEVAVGAKPSTLAAAA